MHRSRSIDSLLLSRGLGPADFEVKYEEIPGVIHWIDLCDSTFVESTYVTLPAWNRFTCDISLRGNDLLQLPLRSLRGSNSSVSAFDVKWSHNNLGVFYDYESPR